MAAVSMRGMRMDRREPLPFACAFTFATRLPLASRTVQRHAFANRLPDDPDAAERPLRRSARVAADPLGLGTDRADQGPAGKRLSGGLGGGEISNLSRPQSGHCYLTLKDDRAQIRAAMWRNVGRPGAVRSARRPGGDLPRAPRRLCPARQLPVDHRRRSSRKGIGALELALRQLREKLAREGLFDPARKRPLPRFVAADGRRHQPHGRGHPRFPPGAGAALARGRRAGRAHPRARRRGRRGDRRRHREPPTACRWRSTAWSSPAAAAAWKTSGRSTRKSWSARSSPRGSRSSRPSATRST